VVRFLAVLVGVALVGAPALAQELAPRVDHPPVTRVTRGEAASLQATIVSPIGRPIMEPAIFVRLSGATRYSRVPLAPDATVKDLFVGRLPDALVSTDFDYYLEAFDADGNGPGRAGSPEAPFHVAVVAPVPVARPETPAQHVQTILLTPTPPKEPRTHTATAALGILGGFFAGAGACAFVGAQWQRQEFLNAQSQGWAYDSHNVNDQNVIWGVATAATVVGGAMLIGALISAVVPSASDEPPPPPPPTTVPATVTPRALR
jgi:hypothetical protein